jgi:concanavalin A-like lectin/glucanase superfamily protein
VPPCPHAVLQSPNSADLNPGIQPLAYGATVRLARSQTSKGQNVVQKGYSATSSQYKMQVDGAPGRPSCVLVDDKTPTIKLVRSEVTVADGAWHAVECSRAADVFIILVDGVIRGTLKIPATLSVTNTSPLSIGGKGTSKDNDQFQGAVDDVWVRIG